mmetsp:Transcript_1185/g.1928  ORF Transcript_1185/g.1928 Transcript_1185/m.1928 type:complete len:363 (-) Transcript_1185:13-1101(-)
MFGMGLGGFDDAYNMYGMHNVPATSGAFTRRLRVHSLLDVGRAELEKGDKIILPTSALDALTRLHIVYPMMFKIQASELPGVPYTHCGVIEFVADEGHAYIPSWMMDRLNMVEGQLITIKNANLPKGTDVKFQPKTVDFLNISNPKVVLEATLRNFTCLTVGDSIPIHYNEKTYWIDVISLQPGEAVSIVEADVRTEFEAPPGYVEPTYPKNSPAYSSTPQTAAPIRFGIPATVSAEDGDGAQKDRLTARLSELRRHTAGDDNSSDEEEEEGAMSAGRLKGGASFKAGSAKSTSFKAFGGTGQTLASGGSRRGMSAVISKTGVNMGDKAQSSSETAKDAAKKKEEEEAKFVPFGGSGRSLRD